MNFKIWLEGLEEYEPYMSRVEATPRTFGFDHLFRGADRNGRIFLPFADGEAAEEERQAIEDIADAIGEWGYEIADIKKGYARMRGKQNLFRIGKLLDRLKHEDSKRNASRLASGEISRMRHDADQRRTERYYDDLKSSFENMSHRAGSEMEIVISKNPHDIASMSTGRGWTSCMNLSDGQHKDDVYCEVGYGGFIAYLVHKGDKDVERPIARVHIRRFDNRSGKSVAVPEETVYGTDKEGFLGAVRSWLDGVQGRVAAGPYTRVGGRYSDTFGGEDRRHFVRPNPSDSKKIMGWINRWIKMDRQEKAKFWRYFAEAMSALLAPGGSYPRKFLRRVRDYIYGERVSEAEPDFSSDETIFRGGSLPVDKGWNQSAEQFIPKFALKFPDTITKAHFIHAFQYAAKNRNQEYLLGDLAKGFPEFVDEGMLKVVGSRKASSIAEKIPSLSGHHLSMVEDELTSNLRTDNPRFSVWDSRGRGLPGRGHIASPYEAQNNMTDEIDKLKNFKPIPERLVRRLIDFVSGVDKIDLVGRNDFENDEEIMSKKREEARRVRDSVLRHAIHVLALTGTDTPSVQNFYRSLLPRWEEAGGIGVLGWAIAHLGENGRSFLPFLKKKRSELEGMDIGKETKKLFRPAEPERYEKGRTEALEAFDWVIDSVEKGTLSQKHVGGYGDYLDARLHDEKNRDEFRRFASKVLSGGRGE